MEYFEYIGPYIRYMREKLKISSGELCVCCDISRLQLSHIESGKYDVHPNILKKLLDQMGLAFITLFRNQDEYKVLLEKGLKAFIFDDVILLKEIMEQINAINFEESILFPEYLIIALFDTLRRNTSQISIETERILHILEFFIETMPSLYQFLYHVLKGYYEVLKHDYKKALEIFQAANNFSVIECRELLMFHLGNVYALTKQYLRAISYYEKAQELYTKQWNINRMLYTKLQIGNCYNKMGVYDIAIAHLQEVSRIAIQYQNHEILDRCYVLLALASLNKQEYKECIKITQEASKMGNKNKMMLFYRAYACMKLNNRESAALWLEKRYEYPGSSLLYKYLEYANRVMEGKDPIPILEDILQVEEQTDDSLHTQFILMELINYYHKGKRYEDEACSLRKLMQMN